VLHVLNFYAGVPGSPTTKLAEKDNHVLFLVSQVTYENHNCFAMPVQFFDGPRETRSEMEVLLPPFVHYEFEEDLALSSEEFSPKGPLPSAENKLKILRRRWKGFELPEDLVALLQRKKTGVFEEVDRLRPFISVRFVRSVVLHECVRTLFTDPVSRLYDFGY
jgi:hypothetical protein